VTPRARVRTRKKRRYTGTTRAYKRFHQNTWRISELLDTGLLGLSGKQDTLDALVGKLADAKGIRGPRPKDYEPCVEVNRKEEGDGLPVEIKLDPRSALLLKRAVIRSRTEHGKIRYHLYSILAVSVWGAFETYLTMLFEELFRKQPAMLKSSETLTFEDAVNRRDDILEHLIDRNLDKIGHFTFKETVKHLKDKLNFGFSNAQRTRLEELYLIRNIVAHNSGVVRNDLKAKLPASVSVEENEIRITKGFLEDMIVAIEQSVTSIEKHVERAFYKK
jgi:hypothetical protein